MSTPDQTSSPNAVGTPPQNSAAGQQQAPPIQVLVQPTQLPPQLAPISGAQQQVVAPGTPPQDPQIQVPVNHQAQPLLQQQVALQQPQPPLNFPVQVVQQQPQLPQYGAIPPSNMMFAPMQQQPTTLPPPPPAYAPQNPIPEEALPRNVYVCHLDFGTPETKLAELFQPFGEIESLKLMLNVTTGRSRGCAFILFKNHADAARAIAKMNDAIIDGRCVHVKFADNTAKPAANKKTRTAVDIVQGITPATIVRNGPGSGGQMNASMSSTISAASSTTSAGMSPSNAALGNSAVLMPGGLPTAPTNVLIPQQQMLLPAGAPQAFAGGAAVPQQQVSMMAPQPQSPIVLMQLPNGQLAQVVQTPQVVGQQQQAHAPPIPMTQQQQQQQQQPSQVIVQQPQQQQQFVVSPNAAPAPSAAATPTPLLNMTPPKN